MNRDGHNNASFFVGAEVEHTPAFSKKTLFVVGVQDTTEIEKHAKDNKTPHIFLGANHSFDASHNTEYFSRTWNDQIKYLLDRGFWVTLDYQAHQHETVLKILSPGVWQSRLFVPLLSVRIPKIETSSVNLTVKIDDIDFNATNRGVWCMSFHEVTDSNRFTDWQEYESDNVIAVSVPLVPLVPLVPDVSVSTIVLIDEDVSVVKNEVETGLDATSVSALKPEIEQVAIALASIVKSPEEAAAAYADGATVDPLSAEASKKPKAKK